MDLVTPSIGLIFWQTITFLIVLLVLSSFVWKPIIQSLKIRESQIDEAIRSAELAKQEMQNIHNENEALLRESRIQRDTILKKAKEDANKIVEAARAQTSEITQKMLDDARKTIVTERNQAVSEIRNLVAEFSIEIAEKVIKKELSNDLEQKKLVDKLLDELKFN